MNKRIPIREIPDKTFGDWYVLKLLNEKTRNKWPERLALCICTKCGFERKISAHTVAKGNATNCNNCSVKWSRSQLEKKLARRLNSMKDRCCNPNSSNYPNYGGRGISICERWLENTQNFIDDMIEGFSPELSLDRIDNNGNYCKENCRWVNMEIQCNNRRISRTPEERERIRLAQEASAERTRQYIESFRVDGVLCTAEEIAGRLNIPKHRVIDRMRKGESAQQIVDMEEERDRKIREYLDNLKAPSVP